MVVSQRRAMRTVSGSRYKDNRGKRMYEFGNLPVNTKIGERQFKTIKGLAGQLKPRLLQTDYCNLADPSTKKIEKVKVTTVTECPANRHFARRNILVKGSVIVTDKGKAKVTSRPGQDGIVNAILIK